MEEFGTSLIERFPVSAFGVVASVFVREPGGDVGAAPGAKFVFGYVVPVADTEVDVPAFGSAWALLVA